MDTSRKKKVLFLSPHAAIWPHAFPEALLAESLLKSGHEICYVTCGGAFKAHCEGMDAHEVSHAASLEERSRICSLCQFQAQLLRKNLQLPGYSLADVVMPEDVAWANRLVEAAPREATGGYRVEGMPVGQAALDGLLLHSKDDNRDAAQQHAIYRVELYNTLIVLAAVKRLLAKEKPDAVMLRDALYPVNQVVRAYLEALDVPCYGLDGRSNLPHRLQHVAVSRGGIRDFSQQQLAAWPAYRAIPPGEDAIRATIDHIVALVQNARRRASSSARSQTSENLRQHFAVPGGVKVLVATMSRDDLREAEKVQKVSQDHNSLLFQSQVDWLRAVIAYVAERPDLFVIIRVHPCDVCDTRSPGNARVKALLTHLPANVRINWPSEAISLFDLAEISDVILNAGSSAGKQMALLGIPVVVYSRQLVSYPADLNYLGDESRSHYFEQVERALAEGWRAERMVEAMRWYALEHHWSLFDLRESMPAPEDTPLGPQGRHLLTRVAHAAEERLDVYQRAVKLAQAHLLSEVVQQSARSLLDVVEPESFRSVSGEESVAVLRTQLRRLLAAWHGDRVPTSLSGLFVRLYSFANG